MALFLLAVGFVWVLFYLSERWEAGVEHDDHQWLVAWIIKGFGVPALVWFSMMVGLFPGIPRLVPRSPFWVNPITSAWNIFTASGEGLFLIGTFWLAFTLEAYFERYAPRVTDRWELIVSVSGWAILTSPVAGLLLWVYGWPAVAAAFCVWMAPVVMQLSNYAEPVAPKPMYAQAIAMMKRGKYADAEWAVIRELEKREDDYNGWMMLAELYATQFHDLKSAVQTISDLCSQPNITPSQAAIALHRLADWQLQLADDPGAARLVLEQIGKRYPGTHLAHMADQRIQQLPATPEALRQQRIVKKIHLPTGLETFDEAMNCQRPDLGKEMAAELANEHSQRLARNPNDLTARAEFARLLAENLGQAKLAIEQLDLLLAMPNPPDSQKAGWLLFQAAWQFKYLEDKPAAKKILARLVAEYPKSPQAFSAQRKLARWEVEDSYQRMGKGRICLPEMMGAAGGDS